MKSVPDHQRMLFLIAALAVAITIFSPGLWADSGGYVHPDFKRIRDGQWPTNLTATSMAFFFAFLGVASSKHLWFLFWGLVLAVLVGVLLGWQYRSQGFHADACVSFFFPIAALFISEVFAFIGGMAAQTFVVKAIVVVVAGMIGLGAGFKAAGELTKIFSVIC